MRTIYKYILNLENIQTIDMPKVGLIRHVGAQNDKICLWVEVDSNDKGDKRTFAVFGTGDEIPKDKYKGYYYIATVQMGVYVWHIFEQKG